MSRAAGVQNLIIRRRQADDSIRELTELMMLDERRARDRFYRRPV